MATAVWLLALGGLRWWWGCEADRRLQAQIAEYRAAGEPVYLEDFAQPPVPDDQNAAKLYYQAYNVLVATLPEKVTLADGIAVPLSVDDVSQNPQLITTHADAVARLIEANGPALKLAHEARLRPGADWGVRLTSPVIAMTLPQLSQQRRLARLVCIDARYRHACGDDDGAVEATRDALAMGRDAVQVAPTLMARLAAQSMDGLATAAVEALAPRLLVPRISADEVEASRTSRRPGVDSLIRELLDEQEIREDFLHSGYGERMALLDAMDAFIHGPLSFMSALAGRGGLPSTSVLGLPERALFTPARKFDLLRAMRYATSHALATQAPNWLAARAMFAPDFDSTASGPMQALAHAPAHLLIPTYEQSTRWCFVRLAQRRMAAIALAVRLYEIDHGQRPAALAELVPTYLPAVPSDPFAADDRPIGYAPHASPPVLYSVSFDGVDDGGAFALKSSGEIDRDAKDMPFFLNGDRPRRKSNTAAAVQSRPSGASAPASTQALDDQK